MEKKTIVVVAVIVAVIVVGIAAAVGGIVWFVFKATAPPVEAVRAHLAAINQGDYARAYTYLHTSVQQQMSLEDFQGYVETNSSVVKTTDKTFPNRSKPVPLLPRRLASYDMGFREPNGRIFLVHQGDRW